MKKARVLLGIAIVLTASAAWAQKVDVDWDRDADFSKFKTYAWTDSKHPAQGLWAQRRLAAASACVHGLVGGERGRDGDAGQAEPGRPAVRIGVGEGQG